ncbi:unnamed protein product, partial [Iphiclides podalirius]
MTAHRTPQPLAQKAPNCAYAAIGTIIRAASHNTVSGSLCEHGPRTLHCRYVDVWGLIAAIEGGRAARCRPGASGTMGARTSHAGRHVGAFESRHRLARGRRVTPLRRRPGPAAPPRGRASAARQSRPPASVLPGDARSLAPAAGAPIRPPLLVRPPTRQAPPASRWGDTRVPQPARPAHVYGLSARQPRSAAAEQILGRGKNAEAEDKSFHRARFTDGAA